MLGNPVQLHPPSVHGVDLKNRLRGWEDSTGRFTPSAQGLVQDRVGGRGTLVYNCNFEKSSCILTKGSGVDPSPLEPLLSAQVP